MSDVPPVEVLVRYEVDGGLADMVFTDGKIFTATVRSRRVSRAL